MTLGARRNQRPDDRDTQRARPAGDDNVLTLQTRHVTPPLQPAA
jgi:hypothetical protein